MNKEMITILFVAGIIIIMGIGIMIYVYRSMIKKMKVEFEKTGFYPYGDFFQKGIIYSIPLAVIIGYLLLPNYDSFSRWSSLPFVTAVCLPGIIIGYIMEKRNAFQVRPRTDEEKQRKNRLNLWACGLLTMLIVYKVFIHKY